jgi:hypothetical protein
MQMMSNNPRVGWREKYNAAKQRHIRRQIYRAFLSG